MSNTQESMFDDEQISAEERELFGDRLRPMRPDLDEEGDFIVGAFVKIEHNVDLKSGFDLVDVLTLEGQSGAMAGRTKRVRRGQFYAWALLHATAKNQYAALDPEPAAGERIAIRRGREFTSNVEGPSFGKLLVAWDVVMPDRKF